MYNLPTMFQVLYCVLSTIRVPTLLRALPMYQLMAVPSSQKPPGTNSWPPGKRGAGPYSGESNQTQRRRQHASASLQFFLRTGLFFLAVSEEFQAYI